MSEERRQLHELVARYKIEPTLRDVYVEGEFDSTVMSWFLRQHDCDDVVVYEIDTVEVPAELLQKYTLDEGEKGRVIAACRELASEGATVRQVIGIVDRDSDTLIGVVYDCNLLLFTDYSCMEMYCLNEAVLGKYFHFIVRNENYTPTAFIDMCGAVLKEAFLIRAVNHGKKYGLTWLELDGQCRIKKGQVEFDAATFVQKYLNKNAKLDVLADFNQHLEEYRAAAAGLELRHCANGHDFVCLLAKYINRAMRNKNFADPDIVERQIISDLDYEKLAEEPMFKALLDRVRL